MTYARTFNKVFCFLDLETTGLDPVNDYVLEIGWQFTDEEFKPLTLGRSFVIDHGHNWGGVWNRIHNAAPIVRNMHTQSGLITDLLSENVVSPADIHQQFIDDILGVNDGKTVHLAGDSVWFDRDFLTYGHMREHFSDVMIEDIHHRLLDLSSIKVFLEAINRPANIAKGTHRALDDVYASIDGARTLKAYMDDFNLDV